MNEQLKLLIELQEMDSSILSLTERIYSLPGKLEKFKAPLKESNESFQKAKARYDNLDKKKKDKDLQLDEIQDKINKLKARSSEIKTNKEYEAHLKEIEGFKKNRYQIEDEILSLMEDIDNFSNELQKGKMKIKKAEEEFEEQEKIIEEEKKKLDSEIEIQKAKRKDFSARIDNEHYTQYLNLIKKMNGLAVVSVKNEVCLGCNYNIPPQLYNDIKKNDQIFTCYYCKRFLYYKESPASDIKAREVPPA